MKQVVTLLIAICLWLTASAQNMEKTPSMMESNLKMYVVVAVLLIIFAGIILFLLGMDRRLKKLEEGE